jgi:hypothetical protein
MNTQNYKINSELDLVFEREVDVPVEVVWGGLDQARACWCIGLLRHLGKPSTVVWDLRPGGEFFLP